MADTSQPTVGRIIFGPRQTSPDLELLHQRMRAAQSAAPIDIVHACNCIGPQPGQTKCPCALRAESTTGERMIRDGVTINGRRYRLVPED